MKREIAFVDGDPPVFVVGEQRLTAAEMIARLEDVDAIVYELDGRLWMVPVLQ